jgi:hypothetical protein
MRNDLNFTIPVNFPVNEVATAIAEQLAPLFAANKPQEIPTAEKYRTRKETATVLKVSLPTLNEYTKRNLIAGYRFGARVMYKQSDIEAALTKMQYGRGSHV